MQPRQLVNFAHTIGGMGMLGAFAALLVTHATMPDLNAELRLYAQQRDVMDGIARWILLPSMGITLLSGLASMALVRAYQSAGWAWIKLGSAILMFEGTRLGIQGPIQREAILAQAALEATTESIELGSRLQAEYASLWVIGFVAMANVALGIFRPTFGGRGLFSK